MTTRSWARNVVTGAVLLAVYVTAGKLGLSVASVPWTWRRDLAETNSR